MKAIIRSLYFKTLVELTKIFHFEMAHAIHGYEGACKNIHGHSYELHVTVSARERRDDEYIPAPGLIFDFRELKQLVTESIVKRLDHKLVLSQNHITAHQGICTKENLVVLAAEPTAENLLIYIKRILSEKLPLTVQLTELKLYETKDSFAKWVNGNRR